MLPLPRSPFLPRPKINPRWLALALVVLAGVGPARAQGADEARVSLITILPGDVVYSLFGHSALRLYDPATDLDVAFNYGTFSFGNPLLFVGQFAYGQLDYALSIQSYQAMIDDAWNREGRPVIEQVLALNADQRNALFQFLRINAREENRYYPYDFFFDNCSTRIRDAFETVFADAVTFAPEPDLGLTFRDLIDAYAVEQPLLDFGMDLGLGLPTDRIATAREAVFLPLYLMEAFDHATITVEGQTVPLVARTDTVFWSDAQASLTPAWPWPSILLWGLFAVGLWITVRDVRTARAERRLFDGLLFGTVGVAGLVIVFLWFISLHSVTHWNLNLLWAWPTHLIVAWVLIRRARPRWMRVYLPTTGLATLGMSLAFFFLPQALPAAVLPVLLLLTARIAALAYTQHS